jgi:hypothetical protein
MTLLVRVLVTVVETVVETVVVTIVMALDVERVARDPSSSVLLGAARKVLPAFSVLMNPGWLPTKEPRKSMLTTRPSFSLGISS